MNIGADSGKHGWEAFGAGQMRIDCDMLNRALAAHIADRKVATAILDRLCVYPRDVPLSSDPPAEGRLQAGSITSAAHTRSNDASAVFCRSRTLWASGASYSQTMRRQSAEVTAPIGVFSPESLYAGSAGMDRLGPKPLTEITAMLKEAGYANKHLVLFNKSDIVTNYAMPQVIAKRLVEAAFNVDDQVMGLATVVNRRNNRKPPDKEGWSLIFGTATCADLISPLLNLGVRTGAAAWIGWPTDPVMEELRELWLDSADPAE